MVVTASSFAGVAEGFEAFSTAGRAAVQTAAIAADA